MPAESGASYMEAIRHFQFARWQATFEQILARLRGESVDLLSYDEVRRMLHAEETPRRSLREIPLDAIVGSVGRYADFTRTFLPLKDSDQARWTRVEVQMSGLVGLPPIDVYQIGEVYFVQDGNHRVSVARQLGATHIEAYVTEVETKVPLNPEDSPDDLIIKAEYVDFLEATHLDELRPQADLRVTAPGRYPVLLEEIEVHRHYLARERGETVSREAAALDWFDNVYHPIARMIHRQGLLREFPDRTRLDLYVWLRKHRQTLREMLGWDVAEEVAIADIAAQHSPRPERVATRLGQRLLDALLPDSLESGPAPGLWRAARDETGPRRRLFRDILVPISGKEEHWFALSQALHIARREGGQVLGLYVVPEGDDAAGERVRQVRSAFFNRTAKKGVPVQFAVDSGPVARVVCDRTRWTDLTVVRLAHPPEPNPVARLGHGLRVMLRRCAGPLLITPRHAYPPQRATLAYNGSPKAHEALFVAAYLAGKWRLSLSVVVVAEGDDPAALMAEARGYLERQEVEAGYALKSGPVVECILQAANDHSSDLLIVGGYTTPPLVEIVVGSTLEDLLRAAPIPILVCR